MTPGALLCPGTGGDLSTFLGAWWGVLAGFPYQPGPTLLDTGRRWKEATTGRECDHRNTAQRQKSPRRSGGPLFVAGWLRLGSLYRRELLLEPCRQHGLERHQQPGQAGGDADHGGADADRLVDADVLDEHRGDHHEGDSHGNGGPDGPPGRVLHSVPPASGYQWASPMSSAVDWSTIPVIGRPKSRW